MDSGSASNPMALCDAFDEGLIQRGDIVVISGEAAGSVIGTPSYAGTKNVKA
jgi:3-oxoacyl-[acyl-carrier-protein] synthase III